MESTVTTSGIKSKERVKKHGEVFTPDSIVNAMLDLVDKSIKEKLDLNTEEGIWEYIDNTYLEPSCGNGNFLVRILDRKLEMVQKLPVELQEFGLVRALSKIYAVDIQDDNVEESKERLLNLIKTGTTELLELPDKEVLPFHFSKFDLSEKAEKTIKLILNNNIKVGNTLNGKVYSNGLQLEKDLILIDYAWNTETKQVYCSGHTLEDIKNHSTIDRISNNKIVNYLDLDLIAFNPEDVFIEEIEDNDF